MKSVLIVDNSEQANFLNFENLVPIADFRGE